MGFGVRGDGELGDTAAVGNRDGNWEGKIRAVSFTGSSDVNDLFLFFLPTFVVHPIFFGLCL
jgi:hypothetical protein